MVEMIYLIPLIILIIVLFFYVISLKNNNNFLTKSYEEKDLKILELEKNLKDTEASLVDMKESKTELSSQLEAKSELLSQEKIKYENLLILLAELQKAKPKKDGDVIIEYFLKTKK